MGTKKRSFREMISEIRWWISKRGGGDLPLNHELIEQIAIAGGEQAGAIDEAGKAISTLDDMTYGKGRQVEQCPKDHAQKNRKHERVEAHDAECLDQHQA